MSETPIPPLPKAAPPAIPVRILTLNLFLRPPLVHSHGSDHKTDRLARFIKTVLPLYDVVALQECFAFATDRRDKLIAEAAELGFKYHAACNKGSLVKGKVDGGLLILSRLEIVQQAECEFARGVHSDWMAAKGVVYAKIATSPASHLHLFTTHLQASYGGGPHALTEPSVKTRSGQIAGASGFISRLLTNGAGVKPCDRVLFVGDFNVNGRPDPNSPATAESPAGAAAVARTSGSSLPQAALTAHSEEYNLMIAALKTHGWAVRDLLYEASGHEHPVTTGTLFEGTVAASESSIDYIFELVPLSDGGAGSGATTTHGGVFLDVKTEEFRVEDGLPYTHISDHFGVSCVFDPPVKDDGA
ncbi:Sphingomyelin phosphodiesterase 2, neutral membrane (Neutral sphingomyelinase) [Geranomyces variabilis]|nr:Sphingomyelin phosphodiesterase 2, neutral membrane (Neutral sphingomyelinase) [Geranomyces variabilis]